MMQNSNKPETKYYRRGHTLRRPLSIGVFELGREIGTLKV
jgi:hypothetical protein